MEFLAGILQIEGNFSTRPTTAPEHRDLQRADTSVRGQPRQVMFRDEDIDLTTHSEEIIQYPSNTQEEDTP